MTTTTIDTTKEQELEVLVERIREEHESIGRLWRATLDRAIALGEMLIEAKGRVRHGGWGPTLERAGVPQRTAQHYMGLARESASVCGFGQRHGGGRCAHRTTARAARRGDSGG